MTRLKADTAVYGGYVMARDEGVVFVKGAMPGELVDVTVTEKKRDYSLAVVREVVEPSPFRVDAVCPRFGTCGGCQLQYASYENQVLMKEGILLDSLKRIGGLEVELMPSLSGADFGFRRRAQFKVSKDGIIGLYKESTRDVVPIDQCPVMSKNINDYLNKVKTLSLSGVKELHITDGDSVIALVKGKGYDGRLATSLRDAGFTGVAFDDHSHVGAGFVSFGIDAPDGGTLAYTVSAWSFLQSNWELSNAAAGFVLESLMPLDGKRVVDLYAGGGNFSLLLAAHARGVAAVEENADSVKDGERNVALNNIKNFRFVCQRAEKASLKGDIVILDPPRAGLSDRVAKAVLEALPERIAYISCNPSTLARDLKKFSEKYEIYGVRMMDFFPHTYHIETMSFLRRRE